MIQREAVRHAAPIVLRNGFKTCVTAKSNEPGLVNGLGDEEASWACLRPKRAREVPRADSKGHGRDRQCDAEFLHRSSPFRLGMYIQGRQLAAAGSHCSLFC